MAVIVAKEMFKQQRAFVAEITREQRYSPQEHVIEVVVGNRRET